MNKNTNESFKTENWTCANCGGTLKWNIQKQQLECASCRTPREIVAEQEFVEQHDYDDYASLSGDSDAFPEKTSITCKTCGAQIIFSQAETAKVCPMCGSTQVAADKQIAGVSPDGVVPFMITKEQAQQNFHKWVKTRWFAPNALKKAYQQGRLDGIYIPFWTFDAEVDGSYTGQGGEEYTETDSDGDQETHVRWYPVNGNVKGSFDDLAVCASSNRITTLVDSILPFSTEEKSVPYASAYLSGFSAEHYALGADVALDSAKQTIKSQMNDKAESDIHNKGYDRADVKRVDLTYNKLEYKQVLAPVWTSAFSYANKQYLYLINGETGEVGGERPYSIPKITAAVIVAVILIIAFTMFLLDDSDTEETSRLDSNHYAVAVDYGQSDNAWYLQDEFTI